MVLSLFNCVVLVVKIVLVLVVSMCKGMCGDSRWSAIGRSGMRNIVQSISVVLLLRIVPVQRHVWS